ncbi:MAG: hypothetical protein HS115_10935 [Spirochaetales bacterium]|nr:hypothetical protein [Spirochaetales bacterium]
MKRLLIALPLLFLGHCLSSPLQGFLYTGTEFHHRGAENKPLLGPASVVKRGEACSYGSILQLLTAVLVDYEPTIEQAMANGAITSIAVVDRRSTGIFFNIFAKDCIVVWGE